MSVFMGHGKIRVSFTLNISVINCVTHSTQNTQPKLWHSLLNLCVFHGKFLPGVVQEK